ncbi:MAG TPA: hypothetical protein VHE30_00310 [Polyangiaceae bacterium]|nr:hypothetical protein [Polyangiaceae bacterium]
MASGTHTDRVEPRSIAASGSAKRLAWIGLVFLATLPGCIPNARWYTPIHAARTSAPAPELETRSVFRDGTRTRVSLASLAPTPDVAVGRPTLATPEGAPCASGIPAVTLRTLSTSAPLTLGAAVPNGGVDVFFDNGQTDPERLLVDRPTVLDVPVYEGRPGATPKVTCLRIPLLDAKNGQVEYRQDPTMWIGWEFRVSAPLHRFADLDALIVAPFQVGALVGPLRLGVDFGLGLAAGPKHVETGEAGAGGVLLGANVQSPALAFGRFGTALQLGYLFESWSKGQDLVTRDTVSVGIREARAALLFMLVPRQPPSSAYDARTDAWSTGLSFSASLLQASGEEATPALGGAFFTNLAP